MNKYHIRKIFNKTLSQISYNSNKSFVKEIIDKNKSKSLEQISKEYFDAGHL